MFGAVVFGVIRAAWIETIDRTLQETAEQVTNNSRAFLIREFGSPTRIGVALAQLDIFRASGVFVQAWLLDSEKPRLAGASDNLGSYDKPFDANTMNSPVSVYTGAVINGTELRILTSPVRVPGQDSVFMTIQTAASMETINAATDRLAWFMLVCGLLSVLGAFMLGMWLSVQTLRPVDRIIAAADSISTAQDLQTRLPWDGPMDELGRLTTVFNRMVDRLERLFNVQQRFVADVSHELRTPLTTIKGNLDLAKRYGMDAASMDAIESETERMSRLVNDLLLLARADYGGLTLELAPLDLDTVLADVYRQAQVLAKDRDLTIRLAPIEPVRLLGNSDRIRQLLLNLVTNAINFTPDGGSIVLRLQRTEREALLAVEDTGIGIDPKDIDHIFDRFYQADESRTRSGSGGSAGLGLAIAKWIAEAHKGTIEVKSTPRRGTVFTVRLPLADAAVENHGLSNGYAAPDWPTGRRKKPETSL
jgi:signal transduction histidine kinase